MSREDFNKTWLTEMPSGLGSINTTFDAIEYNINDILSNNVKPISITTNLKKIELSQTIYYWYETGDSEIVLGVELEKKPQGLVVRLTGKNPKYKGKMPYASNLYSDILKDNKNLSLRLFSDITMSDEGKAIWDRLFDMGLNVSVYDSEYPGKTFKTFKTKQDKK